MEKTIKKEFSVSDLQSELNKLQDQYSHYHKLLLENKKELINELKALKKYGFLTSLGFGWAALWLIPQLYDARFLHPSLFSSITTILLIASGMVNSYYMFRCQSSYKIAKEQLRETDAAIKQIIKGKIFANIPRGRKL